MDINNNKKVLDLIYNSIKSEGGDGDAIWLSKHTSLKDILVLIREYDLTNNTGWIVEINDNYLSWGIDQEWAIITDNKDFFDSQPSWIILRINY
jgi:hypothetical protein